MRETVLATATRNLALLQAVVADRGQSSVAALARAAQVPVASAHRHIAALVAAGFLAPAGYGRHLPGLALRKLARAIGDEPFLATAARPFIEKLAARTGNVVQLGVFEADMVTYLVKAGESADALFTKVGMQLEAYCSGIGKVLLANLSEREQARYLAGGPFIALTERTITEPERLKTELDLVAGRGFAVDDEEVVAGLQCLAVPVVTGRGEVIAAVSTSRAARDDLDRWQSRALPQLSQMAREIGRTIGVNEEPGR